MAAPLQGYSCYFVVCPSPVESPNGLQDRAGNNFFYIKFGDGDWQGSRGQGRYLTHNPTFAPYGNDLCFKKQFYERPVINNPGTYLKKEVLRSLNLTQYMNGEWYIIRPGGQTMAQLNHDLRGIGNFFENADLGFNAAGAAPANLAAQRRAATHQLQLVATAIFRRLRNQGYQ
ncbi:hypothetical protein FRC07_000338 [Ceratobasidium sp. 392]|nr:hypothetical protein FRC07_000338 [Ceratobasidium sp. 392]